MKPAKAEEKWLGQTLQRNYRIDSVLGKGGQAVIYRGVDLLLQEAIALKQFRKKGDEEHLERFKREARHQMKLSHQNIVATRAIIEEDDEYFIVMEYIDGTDLGHLISVSEERPCLPLNQIRSIFDEVLGALGYAHQQGVIHRDIKPPNIMLTTDYKVKLADFGLARQLQDRRLTVEGQLLGTPAYTAPEILQGASTLDPRCDIYSVGVSLYETICGCTPFLNPGEVLAPFELMGRHLFMEPPSPKEKGVDISDDLSEVIMQSIAKDPEDRFANCEDFQDALLSVMQDATRIWQAQNLQEAQGFSRDTTIIQRPEFANDPDLSDSYGQEEGTKVEMLSSKTEHQVEAIPAFLQQNVTQLDAPPPSVEINQQPEIPLAEQTLPQLSAVPQEPQQRPIGVIVAMGIVLVMIGMYMVFSGSLKGFFAGPKKRVTVPGVSKSPSRKNAKSVVVYPQRIPGVAMVYIPEGKFVLGKYIAKRGESFRPRRIFLSAYWIDQFEVTVKQYRTCVKSGNCPNPPTLRLSNQRIDNMPMTRVTWKEAASYCRWAGKHLPSEAQWEKAARGPRNFDYPWGNSKQGCDYANHCKCREGGALPVGAKQRAFGRSHYEVFDMAGNVMEWTRDCYEKMSYRRLRRKDPIHQGGDCAFRPLRGGAWTCQYNWLLYSYTRLGFDATKRRRDIGFRCAWTPPSSKSPS